MKTSKSVASYTLILVLILTFQLFDCTTQPIAVAEKWSITALADPRMAHETFENALKEVRDHDALGKVGTAKFIVVCGDYDPLSKNVERFQGVFSNVKDKPQLLPVVGNHDLDDSDFSEAVAIVKNLEHTTRRDEKLNYYVDYKNVRIIAVNVYSDHNNDLGDWGCLNSKGIEWIDSVISSATHADHIFIAMHEPSFPRKRHFYDSFNQCEEERDSFWDMIVGHNGKVKAVLVGHTHHYYRMRVKDPRSAEANSRSEYPDQEGGVYQIDCGACGNGVRSTVVNIEIIGKNVFFRVVDAGGFLGEEFSLIDEWEIRSAQ